MISQKAIHSFFVPSRSEKTLKTLKNTFLQHPPCKNAVFMGNSKSISLFFSDYDV